MSLLKPRTLIAFMLYGTFCYLAISGEIAVDAVVAVVSALMTFYYTGKKNGKQENNGLIPKV